MIYSPQMKYSALFSISLLAAFLAGCGSSEEASVAAPPPQETAAPLEQAFAGADENTRRAAEMAAAALKSNEEEKAVVGLMAVRNANMTVEQSMAVQQSMVSLQKRLAAAAGSGDTNAMRIIELIRSTQPR